MAVNNVAINDIMKIIKDTNPKDAVDKIIEETRSLIAEITKQMSEAKLTEKNKLRKVLEKLDALKSGGGDFNGKLEDVLQNLNSLKDLDPEIYNMLKPVIDKLKAIQQERDKLSAQIIYNPVFGGTIV
ncbi:hypothetical protein A2230_05140 [candidate division WOR-1 bacterium RIFOXYA2_FULL_36_21]|uniref:Uncharacterized protein n=1 Tax=candidate division WOR-1 bacterium RIFOXYB2_FULL_36_35 TaxID=1802578 RepID=A0A1F4S5W5_UNCSA|nr:MAG: hypothetical protein A2230_05140 [candidate division WOR-1 bacterium RIFOXYA2_FULL_36_21]OGC15789.1 MAG: hypothetical protein A2290_05565 [candidate division WOR-1 bacterium RIFOXYB2_FULL_36_35]OGC16698.1 MAG: hypothetical protein A2282_06035 [candidate division WOR-1 bacterium RIFOXYA12_FULL_36_13]